MFSFFSKTREKELKDLQEAVDKAKRFLKNNDKFLEEHEKSYQERLAKFEEILKQDKNKMSVP